MFNNAYHCSFKNLQSEDQFTNRLKTTNTGVPQGPVLGPVLYLLHITNLKDADDTILLYSGKSEEQLEEIINGDMKILINRLRMNILLLNVNKTNYMKLKQKTYITLRLHISGETLRRTTATYLRLVIDEKQPGITVSPK